MEIRQTTNYASWFAGLRDVQARSRIVLRVERLAAGNPGDVRPVGSGVSELRLTYGPGYRIYYVQRGPELIVLLGGGDKSSQQRDIDKAIELAADL